MSETTQECMARLHAAAIRVLSNDASSDHAMECAVLALETCAAVSDDRALLLSFIASLTLCDHMGDVGNDADVVLKRIGLDVKWEDWGELGQKLDEMGVRTLYGTELGEDEDDG